MCTWTLVHSSKGRLSRIPQSLWRSWPSVSKQAEKGKENEVIFWDFKHTQANKPRRGLPWGPPCGSARPVCCGSFPVVLCVSAAVLRPVCDRSFPRRVKANGAGSSESVCYCKSSGRWKRRRNCPASQNQAMTTGARVLLDVFVRSPWTHYRTWSWPWCPLNLLTH